MRLSHNYLFILLVFISPFGFCSSLSYPVPCPADLKIQINDKLSCGYITVDERHELKNGRQIKIFFINAKSTNKIFRSDPVFYLAGGPGVAPSRFLPALLQEIKFLRKDRDVILIDQRGTGYSQPNLLCNFRSPMYPLFTTENGIRTILKECKKRYESEHMDISAYNTLEDAQDIIALVKALNYPGWNMMGTSNGTVLALAISQFNPKGLRSIVIGAALSLNHFNINDIAIGISNGYKDFFKWSNNNLACQNKYPDLRKHFIEVVESLPKTINEPNKLYLTGEMVIRINSGYVMSDANQKIQAAELIEQMYGKYKKGLLNLNEFKRIYGIKDRVTDLGAMKVITCYDDQNKNIAKWQLKQIKSANKHYPYYYVSSNYYGLNSIDCQILGNGDALSSLRKDLITSVPVLILHGQNDTIPLYLNKDLEKSLVKAKVFEIDNVGHNVLSASICSHSLIEQFFSNPNVWPIKKC